MNITWYGQTCFKVTVPKGKDGMVTILTDPLAKETGLRAPKNDADILLLTYDQKPETGESFVISGPGEYDIKEVYIEGIPAKTKADKKGMGQTTIYTIEAEGIKICNLGVLGQADFSSKDFEAIGDVDILMLPIGGGTAMDAKEAINIMSQIEPKITIPMYYKIPGLKMDLEGIDKFAKSLGIKTPESLPKLSIKKKDLPEGEAKIIILQS